MHGARATFKVAYGQLEQTGQPQWRPVPPHQAIYPDKASYGTVELRPNGDVFGTYADLTRYLRDCRLTGSRSVRRVKSGPDLANSTIEAHHILEHSLMGKFGVSKDEGRCAALEWEDHGKFSKLIPLRLPRGKFYDVDDIVNAHLTTYREHGLREWEAEIRAFLRSPAVRTKILRRYEQRKAPGGDQADFESRKRRVEIFLSRL